MPDIIKISALTELTTLADGDEFLVSDVSEPLDADKTKRIKAQNLTLNVATVLNAVYPVGSIYTSVLSTSPATLFGFGTWAAFAPGRVLVGRDASQAEFDVAEETGGAKTHTLTTEEMPSHTHTQNAHNHSVGWTDGNSFGAQNAATAYEALWGGSATGATTANRTATNQNTGGGGEHNNLQPYIVVYMWKRTA